MGIISPQNRSAVSKVLITLLLIVVSPVLIVAVLLYFVWGAILYFSLWLTRKKFVIFVYSDSPIWKDYIERDILPHIQNRALILNWSERRNWKMSLAVLTFRYFGGYRNFNPIGMVFRPFRFVKTYRFFGAFKDFKHGNFEKVNELREALFEEIGVD